MKGPLSVAITLNQDSIPSDSTARIVYALLEIQPGQVETPPAPLPVNIGIVVDKSDSMCVPILSPDQFGELARLGRASETIVDGVAVWHFENVPPSYTINAPRSIDFVKRALHSIVEKLKARDQFALVAFARQGQVLISSQTGKNKRELLNVIDIIDGLSLGNDTYMATGLNLGLQEVQCAYSREMVNRIVILTDGFTRDDPQCRHAAQQAAQAGVSVSTIGLGVEFNEELLISMADSSRGNAYFIHDPAEIPIAFTQELSGVQNVLFGDLILQVRLMQGAELRRIHRIQPIISDLGSIPLNSDRSFALPLGDLGREGGMAILLELLAPPRPAGPYQLAHCVLGYNQPSLGAFGQKVSQDCIINYVGDPSNVPLNPRVMNIIEKISAFKLQTRALQNAAQGDIGAATQCLKAAATRLINMGEQDLAQAALNEAANLEHKGQMSSEGTKRLRYDTRKLTQKP